MNKNLEAKANEYAELMDSSYTNDYYGFIAGYKNCAEEIKLFLEVLKDKIGIKEETKTHQMLLDLIIEKLNKDEDK